MRPEQSWSLRLLLIMPSGFKSTIDFEYTISSNFSLLQIEALPMMVTTIAQSVGELNRQCYPTLNLGQRTKNLIRMIAILTAKVQLLVGLSLGRISSQTSF